MKKKILSLFCSGLMLFANAPCCAASDASQAKLYDHKTVKDSNLTLSVDLFPFLSDSAGAPQQGVHIAIEPITLKLNKELQPNGTFAKGSSYTIDLTSGQLAIPLSLAYIDEQETEEIQLKFDLIYDSLSSIKSDEEKSKIINLLEKLKGLKFQIKSLDGSSTYLDCYINGCDNNGDLDIPDSPDSSADELKLQPMTSSASNSTTDVELKTQKLNLIISTNNSATASLTDLILVLSELESNFDYLLQIQGEKV